MHRIRFSQLCSILTTVLSPRNTAGNVASWRRASQRVASMHMSPELSNRLTPYVMDLQAALDLMVGASLKIWLSGVCPSSHVDCVR